MAVFTTTAMVQRFAGALYGLKLGSTTLSQVQTDLGSNPVANLDSVLNFYYGATFGAASAEDVAARLLANLDIVEGEHGLDADEVAAAEAYIVANLNAAPAGTWGAAVNSILAAFSNLSGDAQYGEAADAWNAKVDAAVAYGASNAGNVAIDAVDPIVTEFKLTVASDDITGSAQNDTFKANVEQNAAGLQVNTLGSGDELDGGAGTDTLNAKVTTGGYAGGSLFGLSMPIQPETTDIEVVNLEAVWNSILGEDNDSLDAIQTVYVNAKDMIGVNQLWSNRSDADLVIQNLTSQDNNGAARNLTDMTIGMAYTGNADSLWGASDYTVYFDQDYLVPVESSQSTAYYFLLDEDAELAGLSDRLDKIDVDGIRFRVDGGDIVTLESADANTAGTHAGFVAALQTALQAAKDAGLVPADTTLTLDPTITDTTFMDDGSESDPIPAIVLNTNSGATFEPVGFSRIEDEIGEYDVYGRFTNERETDETLAINVALEKVGLAGDGGELIIGSMNKTSDNEWDAVNTVTDTTSGIEQFDVTVYGANDKSSSLAGLHSTNNNLRVVNIVTDEAQTGSYANLTIGNSNTRGGLSSTPQLDNQYALKDVQILNASGFMGNLTVYAALTDEITDKYFSLKDEAADAPEDDNVVFDYTGGAGNDSFNIALDTNNDAFAGNVTREDFVMTTTIDGGAGNDSITVAMVGGGSGTEDSDGNGLTYASFGPFSNEELLANWYDNQKMLANVRIDGGEGNDTIRTPGSGDVIIDAGVGNDAVYADNTGAKATWAFNVEDADGNANARWDIDNLQSDTNDTYRVFKTDVVVSFLGFEARAAVVDTRGVASDLDINQAIKRAINSDPELSKLLEAKDGPGNSLVITSRIDAQFDNDENSFDLSDLVVTLEAPTAAELTTGDLNTVGSWYGTSFGTTAALSSYLGLQAEIFNDNVDGTYNQVFARDGGSDLDGDRSLHTSDNTITLGLGDDVAVLGTGRLSNDTLVYEGFGNGTDTIVHFVSSGMDVDYLNVVSLTNYVQGAAAVAASAPTLVAETFTLEVTAAAAAGTITFNGGTVTLTGTESLAQVVAAFVSPSPAYTDYTATAGATPGTIVFTQTVPGTDLADPTVASFVVGDPTVSGVLVAVVNGADGSTTPNPGSAAVNESFTLTFADADTDTSYTFDGETIPVLAGETGANIAAAVGFGDYANWTAVTAGNTVTFTSATAGTNVTDFALASFLGANVEVVTYGVTDGSDILDFSSYDAVAVQVVSTGQNEVFFDTTIATGELWVRLTESTAVEGDGRYTAELVREAGATDVVVGTIGVLDFGVEQDFVIENFII